MPEKLDQKREKTKRKPARTEISDNDFIAILTENCGLCALTAFELEQKYGVKFTAESVRKRAKLHKGLLEDIIEKNMNKTEKSLNDLMESEDVNIKFKAIDIFTKTFGKDRLNRSAENNIDESMIDESFKRMETNLPASLPYLERIANGEEINKVLSEFNFTQISV